MFEPVLTRNIHRPDSEKISVYLAHGGYQAARKALTLAPEEIIEMVKRSGLRGRGGAGFPAGVKWGFMPRDADVQKIVAVNTDEGEPGTFKDREIVESDPHQVIEGVIIAAYAVGASRAYVYIRGEFFLGVKRWIKAIADAYEHGYLGENILGSGLNLDMSVHRGAGAYICGEETAMLESLEGKRGNPRLKPPYPAQTGLFGLPTLVHNIETLTCIPNIIERGSAWFAGIGTEESKGPKIFSVSGHVKHPGNYELPLGIPLREIIYEHAGGIRGGQKLKAIIPGGTSTPMLTADQIDVPMAFETLKQVGSELGTGAIIVMDESTCMVEAARRLSKFFAHESCGRCTPCRIGSQRIFEILDRMEHGKGKTGDIDLILELVQGIDGQTFCPMGAMLVNPPRSAIQRFREEFEYHITHKCCLVDAMDG
ncbi:MAG: NADH-quinone oxidoreductase subunit NuoF [Anaerolineales bacterium]|nr:NADH-quinone oxidoreductase subunit NuoF [Chloroflexota bacterium]MBL7161248.1 NADH-quinone oxidoreductase subunit NuoF [Anaerolineales bacterium]